VAPVSRAVAYTARGKSIIPSQVIIHSPKGTNHQVALLFGTSLYDLKQAQMQTASDLTVRDGLRMLAPAPAVVRVPEAVFATSPIETRAVLASLRDVSELLRRLLDGGHSVEAGRLAGALRGLGRSEAADEIVTTMKAAGYDVRGNDPFAGRAPAAPLSPAAPIVGRMQAIWESMRVRVLDIFPWAPGLPQRTVRPLCGSSRTSTRATPIILCRSKVQRLGAI
jgi:hypothetical protein